jgi:hypothetical protein
MQPPAAGTLNGIEILARHRNLAVARLDAMGRAVLKLARR